MKIWICKKCAELKIMPLMTISNLFSNLTTTKNANNANLGRFEKTLLADTSKSFLGLMGFSEIWDTVSLRSL